ncbi:hypothetical protein [Helicobacter sp. MIT 11-5569]|nr:hypothetical protein [Helicobacter sp. MIT 11-5569]
MRNYSGFSVYFLIFLLAFALRFHILESFCYNLKIFKTIGATL